MIPKYHPSSSECTEQCAGRAESCQSETGNFEFTAPALVYSPNATTPSRVYIKDDAGNEYPYSTFGGGGATEYEFKLCADFVIRWSIQGEMPDCIVEPPVFYVCAIDEKAKVPATLVCVVPKDNPNSDQIKAWLSGCAECGADELTPSLYSLDGKTKLNLDDYNVVHCC